jgi:hypothetical protein
MSASQGDGTIDIFFPFDIDRDPVTLSLVHRTVSDAVIQVLNHAVIAHDCPKLIDIGWMGTPLKALGF